MVKLNEAGHRSLNSGIAMTVLATIAVILRLLTRLHSKASWGADDLFAVAALLAMYAWFGVLLWGLISGGGGANIQTIASDYDVFQVFLKSLYTLNGVYALAITCVKLSIIYLYRRIFTTRRFQQVSFGVAIVVVIWWIVFTLCTLLPCLPPQKFWHPELEGPCFNYDEFFLGSEIIDIILDFSILTLPVRVISSLQMSRQRKWILYFIFLIGGGVCVTGILRLVFTYVPHAVNISFTEAELWTNIHLGVAIICACLPTYRQLFTSIAHVGSSIWSHVSSFFTNRPILRASGNEHNNDYPMEPYKQNDSRYNQISDPLGEQENLSRAAAEPAISGSEGSLPGTNEPNSITVRYTVEVV